MYGANATVLKSTCILPTFKQQITLGPPNHTGVVLQRRGTVRPDGTFVVFLDQWEADASKEGAAVGVGVGYLLGQVV